MKVSSKKLCFQRVGIFVDAENIELSGLKHHESRTDYKKILDQVGDREVTRILYYKPSYKEISDTFLQFWNSLGGEIKRPAKNADSFLIIDAVTMAEKLDVVLILGGDKDFMPLIWYLKSRGCRVEIWSWPETTSDEIKEAADYYLPLSKDYLIGEKNEAATKKVKSNVRSGGSKNGNQSGESNKSSSGQSKRSKSSGSNQSKAKKKKKKSQSPKSE